ncbi:hypothetical protein [Acuticoccus sediminis]|nr:hypothetical protein [Acuticoccus sediminis]
MSANPAAAMPATRSSIVPPIRTAALRSMPRGALLALSLMAAALVAPFPLASPAAAQDAAQDAAPDAAGTMGQLTTILPETETDGPWTVEKTPAGFTMTNRTDANAVRYFYVNAGETKGARTVSVDVSVEPRGTGPALAGLLYGFDEATKTYFMLVIESGERVGLYRRDPSGMKRLAQAGLGVLGGGPYRLAIAEEGESVEMTVNGKSLGTAKSSTLGKGATGIIAAGIGTFAFSAYSLSSATK